MEQSRIKFILAIGMGGASVILMALANKGVQFTAGTMLIVGPVLAGISIVVLILKKYNHIEFFRHVNEKPKEVADEATRRLCGFSKFVAYNNFIIFESPKGKLTGHAYILLEKLPYMIEQMSKE